MKTARCRADHGLLHVYTGDGKGKTTAALGLTWRALGCGKRVAFLQFLKGGVPTGERLIADRFGEHLLFKSYLEEPSPMMFTGEPTEADIESTRVGWVEATGTILSGGYDVVVLDEVNNVLKAGLLHVEELLAVLSRRPEQVAVVCTGRGAPPALVEAADLVTEMLKIKHPYDEGIAARKGIEY